MPVVEIAWPESLPHNVVQSQFSYTHGSGIIRDSVDAGYPLVRRRYTATTVTYSIALVMTYDEVTTFQNFFINSPGHSTLPGIFYGSVRLSFPDPLWAAGDDETEADRPSVSFRWVTEKSSDPYSITPEGESSDLLVKFKLERLP